MRILCVALFAIAVSQVGCGGDSPESSAVSGVSDSVVCVEPENPYGDGGGHDAGFNWAAETGGSCTGNSDSFNEGCEDFREQLRQYQECLAGSDE